MNTSSYNLPKTYRVLSLSFFALALVVFGLVLYLAWAKVTIIIFPDSQTVSQEFNFNVKNGEVLNLQPGDSTVSGKIVIAPVEGSSTFSATGSQIIDSAVVGEVEIINNYSKEQKLIASTRLAFPDSPDKIVVRLNNDVTVGPGQKIKVAVYPDNAETFSEVAAGEKMIIPGLWGPLQDKIFAQSIGELSKGAKTVAIVSQDDLDQASEKLKQQLFDQSLSQVNNQLEQAQRLWPKILERQNEQINFDVTVGQQASEFSGSMKLDVVAVVFDESQLLSLAREKIKTSLPENSQLISLSPENFTYEVIRYDQASGIANVKASLKGSSVLSANADILDKSKLTGMTEQQIKDYFSQYSEIKSVEVYFQPAWLKKTPAIGSKIDIEIAN